LFKIERIKLRNGDMIIYFLRRNEKDLGRRMKIRIFRGFDYRC